MTTLVRESRPEVFRDYLSERDLAKRWGVSLRTVQRRVNSARSLAPVGVQDRLPHFHRRDVEAYEANRSIAPRMGRSRPLSPIFSDCVAHRKGGQSKTSSCS